jgi:hypothetical protein
MLAVCAISSAAAPVLAILLGPLGWQAVLPSFVLVGAAFNGRRVGFQSALLELAPATQRPTFAALNAVLILPIAVLPLLAGMLLQYWSYTTLFALTAGFVTLGAAWTRRL